MVKERIAMSQKDRFKKAYTRGEWELQRERLRIESHEIPRAPNKEASIGDVLEGVLEQLGVTGGHWLDKLAGRWGLVAGGAISQHTRPGYADGTTLVVYVDSSVWLHELKRFGKQKLLANLQAECGKGNVRDIRLTLDPDGSRGGR
jgi:predicted nucleic acid-binding Zn ribbon protein